MRVHRGFTLLELALAMLLASMLVVTALGLFISLDRSDKRLAQRYEQVNDLDRLQTVLRRTFTTLAVTDENAPAGTPGIRMPGTSTVTPQTPPRSPDAPADAANTSGSTTPRATSVPAPRMRIMDDPDPALRAMVNRSRAMAGGGGGEVLSPQLLEVVTAGQPVPDINPESISSGGVTYAAASQGILLNRGAIYLRPMPGETSEILAEERSWEILYTRLAPRERLSEFGAALGPLQPIGEPIVLASGIRYFNVKVFRQRQWTRVMEATYFQHLPAYVQVEVETSTGLWAKWLFEVGWLLGPETQAERDSKSGSMANKGTDAARNGGKTDAGAGTGTGAGEAKVKVEGFKVLTPAVSK